MSKAVLFLGAFAALGCSGEDSRPGPAGGGAGGISGASGGGGGAVDAGIQCIDDHTQQGIGKTISCGGAYCIPGTGCRVDCQGSQDCRPGFACEPFLPQLNVASFSENAHGPSLHRSCRLLPPAGLRQRGHSPAEGLRSDDHAYRRRRHENRRSPALLTHGHLRTRPPCGRVFH
jgi:hypothetical protein